MGKQQTGNHFWLPILNKKAQKLNIAKVLILPIIFFVYYADFFKTGEINSFRS